MKPVRDTYDTKKLSRDIWLYSVTGFLIVLLSWILIAANKGQDFSFQNIISAHNDHYFLFLFDCLPIYIFLILKSAQGKLSSQEKLMQKRLDENETILRKNSEFAKLVSEGEDPPVFPDMLETELGQTLKLIHLNIMSNRRKEREITWITEGKDMISRILRVYNDLNELSDQILNNLTKYIGAIQGAVYIYDDEKNCLRNLAVLAYNRRKYLNQTFRIGEGLVGQCAYEMDYIYRTEIPEDYITISSGLLGDQKPKSILLVPLITNEELMGVIEFAYLDPRIPKLKIQFMLELGEIIARTMFNLRINEKTRLLLEDSRKMTDELQKNELVLQENAEEMKSTQDQLQKANTQLQKKIEEAQYAQDRLHWLLENASEIISIYDENFRLKYISPSVEAILGYSSDEMMKGKDFERIDQKGSTDIRKAFNQLLEYPDKTIEIEYSFVKKDGNRLYLLSSIRNLLADPSIQGFIFNTRDITQNRLIEKEQRIKSRMQSLSENSLDLIIRVSSKGVIHYVNPVVEDFTGIAPSVMLNRPVNEIPFNNNLQEILNDSLHQINAKARKFNRQDSISVMLGERASERILNFDVIPEFQDNELETILFVGHDITEAKRIEAEIKVTNRKIQDSINYAERIQTSILPSGNSLSKPFPKSFIYYKPKDVISGDFPWLYETENANYIAAIDCTGHGVPGALLSFIGFFLLNNIIAKNPALQSGEVCNLLNTEVRKTLKQDQKDPETRDGMDLALCKVRKDKKILEFTGAHRPLYILREGELTVFKGERKAIGGMAHPRKPETKFDTQIFEYREGDKFFIFSDGLTDQMRGRDQEKYAPSRIRKHLLENPGFTIQQFQNLFKEDFKMWLGDEKQLDDVLLIGVEL